MVLLERVEQLDRLEAAFARALDGERLLVYVEGEAGSGKTALVRHYCEKHSDRARVLWGDCDALFTPTPLDPILDIAKSPGGELRELVSRGEIAALRGTAKSVTLRSSS